MSQPPPDHPDSNVPSGSGLNRDEGPDFDADERTRAGGGSSEGDNNDTLDGIPIAHLLSDSGAASTLFQMDDSVLVTVDETGNRLDSYTDARELSKWTYGKLLEATHPKLERRVRLLVLESPYCAKPSICDAFLDRVRGVASIRSPFVYVGISEAVVDEDQMFLVLEPTRLQPLAMFHPRSKDQQQRAWFYPNQELAQRLLELAQGLDVIHRREMIHGSISKSDLRLNEETNTAAITGLIKTETIVETKEQFNAPILDRRQNDLKQLAAAFANLTVEEGEDQQLADGDLTGRLECNREVSPSIVALLHRFGSAQGDRSLLSSSELVQKAQGLAGRRVRIASWLARLTTLAFELVFVLLLFVVSVLLAVTFFEREVDRGFVLFGGLAPAYLVLSELFTGTTLARRSHGLRLLDRTGTKPHFFRLLGRLLLRCGIVFIPAAALGLGNRWLMFTDELTAWVVGSCAGLLGLYSTSFFLPGRRPLHDFVTGITYAVVDTSPLALSFDTNTEKVFEARQAEEATDRRHTEDLAGQSNLQNKIDQYELKREVGRGGMGMVYQARDVTINRTVAVKSISPHLANRREAVRRFEQEARIAAQLSHRNVAKVYGVGSAAGQPYLVMEFVAGETLQQLVERRGALTVDAAWNYVIQAAQGMRQAGRLGIVHRDIKPSNLMLDESGMIKVMDFGLSRFVTRDTEHLRDESGSNSEATSQSMPPPGDSDGDGDQSIGELTKAGSIVGSPMYMSPEQASAGEVDCRSDIYSLGLTLYAMLRGKPPFENTSGAASLIARQQTESLPPLLGSVPGLTSEQNAVIEQMTAKLPEQRHDDYDSLIADLIATAPAKPELATPILRVVAVLLTWLFVALLELPFAWLWRSSPMLLAVETTIICAVAIYVVGIGFFGQTPGKWLLGLRVVDGSGGFIGWRRALIRYTVFAPMWPVLLVAPLLGEHAIVIVLVLIGWIPACISWILIAWGNGRALHDVAARSRVIRIPPAGRRIRRPRRKGSATG